MFDSTFDLGAMNVSQSSCHHPAKNESNFGEVFSFKMTTLLPVFCVISELEDLKKIFAISTANSSATVIDRNPQEVDTPPPNLPYSDKDIKYTADFRRDSCRLEQLCCADVTLCSWTKVQV